MFDRYYEGELALLRAAGKAYAEAHPVTAGLLSERGSDPDVERLLEGFAFLVARSRERIDAAFPEVIHDLAELLLPHAMRPIPACTIVEMEPMSGALCARSRIKAGTELAAAPVDGTRCRFTTTADLDLLPLAVRDVALDSSGSAAPVLRVRFEAAAAAPSIFEKEGMRLFVHGELPLASTLLLWLGRHLRSVRVTALPSQRSAELPSSSVRLVGLEPEVLPLLPWPRLAPKGYRTLMDYFTLPQKLLFFDVRDLHLARGAAAERFEIAFQFDRPPPLPAGLSRDCFRTNCVPAVNLFKAAADPVAIRVAGEEHLLRAAGVAPQYMEIHSVEEVMGVPMGPGSRVRYEPFVGFRHGDVRSQGNFFRLRRALSPVDGALDTFISVMRPENGAGQSETLSMEVVATNRALPESLKLGELSMPTLGSPAHARIRNIVRPSSPVRPPLGSELHWRLIAHQGASRAPVSKMGVLRSLVGLYALQRVEDPQASRANQLRVDSVREEVESSPVCRFVDNAPVRGERLRVTVDSAGFAGLGDAFLFGCALDDLLAEQASLDSFVEFAMRLEPSGREYAWPPRSGQRVLL